MQMPDPPFFLHHLFSTGIWERIYKDNKSINFCWIMVFGTSKKDLMDKIDGQVACISAWNHHGTMNYLAGQY